MADDNPSGKLQSPTEPVRKTDVNWSPFAAVAYALVSFGVITQFVVPVTLYSLLVVTGHTPQQAMKIFQDSIAWQFAYVLLAEGILFGAIRWFISKHKQELRIIGWRRLRWFDLATMLAGFAVYILVYGVILTVTTHYLPHFNASQKQDLGFNDVSGARNLTLTFLSLVIVPPVVEETVFRGFIFTSLRKKMTLLWSILATSLLFAAAHLEFGSGKPLLWVAGLDTFTLSVVLCYLREKTDSLWPGILLHALKNSIAFVSLYILHLS